MPSLLRKYYEAITNGDASALEEVRSDLNRLVGALSAALVMTRHTDESQSRFAVHRIILSSSTHGH